jgi:hypothetical protein
MKTAPLFVFVIFCACSDSSNESDRVLASEEGDVDGECCKIEGDEIGIEKVIVRLGSKAVRVHDWVAKTGSPGEYVGFSLTVGGDTSVSYKVKASGEVYPSNALTWIHPNGAGGGSASPGISNVDFCDECDNPEGCDGGGGGGDGCDNPDGCPEPQPQPSEPVLN